MSHPNVTDCHCCNHKFNTLQPLGSVWRIILLCRKCHNSIISGQTCPYCLKPIKNSSGDFFKCSVCNNQIHFRCFKEFMNCSPWCYAGIGFITCMDCWVPDFRRISVRLCDRNAIFDKELAVRFRRVFSRVPRVKNKEFFIDPFDLRVWRILNWNGVTYSRIGSRRGDKNRKVVNIGDELELGSDDGGVSCSSGVLESLLCFEAGESGVDVDFSGDRISSLIKVDRFGENFATYKRKRISSTNVNLFWRNSGKRARNHTVLEPHCCQLNQSPWDIMTDFSPPSSPPLPGLYQVRLTTLAVSGKSWKWYLGRDN